MPDRQEGVAALTHEQFAKELTRFAQACSRGDAGQALASRSILLLHDKAVNKTGDAPPECEPEDWSQVTGFGR